MKNDHDRLKTASRLKNWIACNYTTVNEINNKGLKKKDHSTTETIRKKRGDEFEAKIYKKLIKQFPKHIQIKKDEDRFEKTKEAIKKGYDLIHKAHFKHKGWVGEIDFLIIDKNKKTKNGKCRYEVYDTKLSSVPQTDHITQISLYSEWIATQQDNELPDFMYLILGIKNKEKKITKLKIDEEVKQYKTLNYQLYFQKNNTNYIKFLESDKKDIEPNRCSFCAMCEWSDVCDKIWIEKDHLNQIAKIRKDQIVKIKKHGVKTLSDFAKLKKAEKIKDLNSIILNKHLSQAELLIKFKETKIPQYKILPLEDERGFNKIPKSSPHDLFFDIEGLDKILNSEESEQDKQALEYLFGIYDHDNKKEPYKYFWAHNQDEEKEKFVELLEFIDKHLKKYPKAHIYHYNHYEKTALTKLMSKHDTHLEQVNDLLRYGKLVDLHAVVNQGIQVSEREYSLKNLEKFYGYKRKGEIKKANDSTDKYLDWIETGEERLLDEIKLYNREDCESTYFLREWLSEIKPKDSFYVVKKEPEVREKKWEKENEELKKLIEKNCKDKEIKQILKDILGFHNREEMIYWQSIFNRAARKSDEDLIDDSECIGFMEKVNEGFSKDGKGKTIKVFNYKFSKQDFKVQEKDSVINATDGNLETYSVGKILSIDESKKDENTIEISSSKDLPQILSIAKGEFYNHKIIIDAIRRFITSVISGEKKYKATYEFLKKSYPKIKNIKEGETIIKDGNFLEESFKAVESMDNSYLYFQGPPGVGKTHTAAHIIIELIKKSKKIGITANSHKVIFNLLTKIEELSKDDFSFNGYHKSGSTPDKRFNDGKFIKNISDTKKMDLEFESLDADLFSGTAWCFSRPACDEKLDYLFIDEAGQLTTADVLAISLSAKNIVIIGDQMQLSSPISAVHPGDSGQSLPEYLLENNDTISSNKGIFINKSRRLHPKLRQFISENFYDERLKNFDFTEKRKIIFSNKKDSLPETGIVMIDANHREVCRQKSEEEGKLVKKYYNELIGSTFLDEKNNKKIMNEEDILVVAPYNVQVNYLKSILPKGAKVGTIDKFQGQQAPATIISMTTSDPESLPRNIDFFFSRNRLNVAISRSQCLSIVIINKKILEIACKKIKHIHLVNTFMKLLEFEK
ncbi:TM0106 family RecB-like putative nuclease [Candidatus Pelagibacter ubique]|nr:TM0106 family RecB-like putative nuclease [Candidatus Pelagibacter ubique]